MAPVLEVNLPLLQSLQALSRVRIPLALPTGSEEGVGV